jgi:L-ascorbate metabolism protein UlaG (beta-lactamase superfamily)
MRVALSIGQQAAPSGSVAIWWLGQNSYVLRGAGMTIMVDPFFSRPGDPGRYVHAEAPIRADELRPDAVFCTHDHSDHTDPPFLAALAEHSAATRFLGPPESARRIVETGLALNRVTPLEEGETLKIGAVSVEVVLSKRPEVSDVGHFGYVFDFAGPRVYNTGDIMRGVIREPSLIEPLHMAAPHVALITTSPTEEEFPDFAEAAELARTIGARVAIPAHYGCFARRTFDPAAFAAQFRAGETTQAQIIPYCGCYVFCP